MARSPGPGAVRWLLAAAALAAALRAQEPYGPPPPPPVPAPPVDETRAAADLLRRRLGLTPGPAGQVPYGPPPPPEQAPDAPPAPPPAAAAPPPQPAAPQDPVPKPQPQPQSPPNDPTRAAAEALRRLLPRAKPPEAAPIPTAEGTPEPVAPRPAAPDPAAAPVAPTSAPAPTALAPTAPGTAFRGTLWTRYRARHGAGATDQDLVSRLSFDLGQRDRDPYSFHFAARGFVNLDGTRRDDPFPGLDHSFDEDVLGRLFLAHVDAHQLPGLALLRLGRQDLDETPTPLSFDGLRVESQRYGVAKAWLGAHGGVPVHQFEASARGDAVAGVAGGLQPWHGGRLRLDAMHLRDDFLAQDRRDDLLSVRWWQQWEAVQLHGLHTWRDGKPRDLHVAARGDLGLPVQLGLDYRELLTTQRAQVTELDPFWAIAFDYQPYRQLDASLSRDFGSHLTTTLGVAVRRLRDASDEAAFNREYERSYAAATLRDLLLPGLSLSVDGSLWNSQGEDTRSLAGELAYRPGRDLRLSLGSSYDLFRYDVFDDRERLHVRTWFVRGEHRLTAALRCDGGYQLERNDDDEFHLFRVGMTWTF